MLSHREKFLKLLPLHCTNSDREDKTLCSSCQGLYTGQYWYVLMEALFQSPSILYTCCSLYIFMLWWIFVSDQYKGSYKVMEETNVFSLGQTSPKRWLQHSMARCNTKRHNKTECNRAQHNFLWMEKVTFMVYIGEIFICRVDALTTKCEIMQRYIWHSHAIEILHWWSQQNGMFPNIHSSTN